MANRVGRSAAAKLRPMRSTSVLPWQREDQLQNQLHRNACQPELIGALAVRTPGLHTRYPQKGSTKNRRFPNRKSLLSHVNPLHG